MGNTASAMLKATNLNADKLDGKDSTELGVNGLQRVSGFSNAFDSNSPKSAIAVCPPGKKVVGTAYDIDGGKRGDFPNIMTGVVVDEVFADDTVVTVSAYEEEPMTANWDMIATAICAKAP